MSKLYSIGELLIDFQSVGTKSLKNTDKFIKNAGGATANVCVQAVRLGQEAVYLSKVGNDGFGEFLIDTLKNVGVDTSYISKSAEHETSLAFVSFSENGEREFAFYRSNAADLHFTKEDFEGVSFDCGDVLEFGSVALKSEDAKSTHRFLLEKAKNSGAIICFDPNLRFNLWEDSEVLRRTVLEFAAYADIIKVGEDELEFITGETGEDAVKSMFSCGLKILLVTNGGKGAKAYLKDGRKFSCGGYKVKAVDTTGAGDSFFGAFIAQIMQIKIGEFHQADIGNMLEFACKCGAYTTTNYGAIPAMGTKEIVDKAVK